MSDPTSGQQPDEQQFTSPADLLAGYTSATPPTRASTPSETEPETAAEDRDATAAAVQTLLLAATDRGLASYWRTPHSFLEAPVRALLGLAPREQMVALVHLGPTLSEPPAKERRPLAEVVSRLP